MSHFGMDDDFGKWVSISSFEFTTKSSHIVSKSSCERLVVLVLDKWSRQLFHFGENERNAREESSRAWIPMSLRMAWLRMSAGSLFVSIRVPIPALSVPLMVGDEPSLLFQVLAWVLSQTCTAVIIALSIEILRPRLEWIHTDSKWLYSIISSLRWECLCLIMVRLLAIFLDTTWERYPQWTSHLGLLTGQVRTISFTIDASLSSGNSRPVAKKTTKSTKMINGRRVVTTRYSWRMDCWSVIARFSSFQSGGKWSDNRDNRGRWSIDIEKSEWNSSGNQMTDDNNRTAQCHSFFVTSIEIYSACLILNLNSSLSRLCVSHLCIIVIEETHGTDFFSNSRIEQPSLLCLHLSFFSLALRFALIKTNVLMLLDAHLSPSSLSV